MAERASSFWIPELEACQSAKEAEERLPTLLATRDIFEGQ